MPDPGQQNQQQQPQGGAGDVRGLKPPPYLTIDEKVGTSWPLWKQRYELYSKASGLSAQPKDIQSNTLLHMLAEEALMIYNTFNFGDEDAENQKVLLKHFDSYFLPKKNVTFERHVFITCFQQSSEPFDQFVTDIKRKAKSCEFSTLKDSLIKDRIVVGITDDSVRARLLREADLNLQKTIGIYQATEQTNVQMGTLTGVASQKIEDRGTSCKACGRKHPPRRCPLFGKTCSACGEKDHFAYMCKKPSGQDRDRHRSHRREDKRKKHSRRRRGQKMHDLELNTSSSDY